MNVRQDNTTKIIFHDFGFDFYCLIFLSQPALKRFFNNVEIISIQCLIKHFYLIHVPILSTAFKAVTHDSACSYMVSYRNIEVRRRIGIIFESFIRAAFWFKVGYYFAVVRRN